MELSNLTATVEVSPDGAGAYAVILKSGDTIVTELQVPSREAAKFALENLSVMLGVSLMPPTFSDGLTPKH
jgi:hypothetical protein